MVLGGNVCVQCVIRGICFLQWRHGVGWQCVRPMCYMRMLFVAVATWCWVAMCAPDVLYEDVVSCSGNMVLGGNVYARCVIRGCCFLQWQHGVGWQCVRPMRPGLREGRRDGQLEWSSLACPLLCVSTHFMSE